MNNKCETTNASDGPSVNKVNYDLQPSGPHSLKTKKHSQRMIQAMLAVMDYLFHKHFKSLRAGWLQNMR